MAASPLPRSRYDSPISYEARTALGCGGVGGQEPAEGGDAEVELGVVGRVGDAVGPRDLVERPGPELGQFLRGRPGDSVEVAGQVGPGHPGGDELAGGELGLAQVEPGGEAVGPLGILLQVSLEVADRVDRRAGVAPLAAGRASGPDFWPARAIANRSEARRASPLASSRALASRA